MTTANKDVRITGMAKMAFYKMKKDPVSNNVLCRLHTEVMLLDIVFNHVYSLNLITVTRCAQIKIDWLIYCNCVDSVVIQLNSNF